MEAKKKKKTFRAGQAVGKWCGVTSVSLRLSSLSPLWAGRAGHALPLTRQMGRRHLPPDKTSVYLNGVVWWWW